jgi:hypothetical protein
VAKSQSPYSFDVNVYAILLLIFIIFCSLFFTLLRLQPYYLAKYLILPAYNYFYNPELNFILSHNSIVKVIEFLHLDFFIKKFYYYANVYPVINTDTFIQTTNNFIITNKYPEKLYLMGFVNCFILSNFFINLFNLIIFSPVYISLVYILSKYNKNYFSLVSKKQLKKEFKEMEAKAHKYNSDIDAELYVINYNQFQDLSEIEAYLVSIIKNSMNIKDLYIAYIKFFNNLTKLVEIIKDLQNISDKNQLNLNFNKNFEKIYFNKNLKKYGIYQYWIFLMFTAKTIRNFPHANIVKQISKLTGNKEISHILKWTSTRNLPDDTVVYYFIYNLIINMEISSWINKIIPIKYKDNFKKYLEYK